VEVDATNFALELVEANVVESFETGTRYRSNPVVRYQKMLLPSHEDVVLLRNVRNHDRPLASLLVEWMEGAELVPVAEVDLGVGPPVLVLCNEVVFAADDLALEECGQGGMVIS
jgi:hypothetical protein